MSKAQDPFAATSDPNLYVPRAATEAAIDALAEVTWHGDGVAALLGPPGFGKSLLLRVLARRAEEALHCIHVPVPTLDPEGITLWAASRLPGGRRLGGSDALLEVARERPLLLLIEDAELLPEESARAVAELHRASEGAIRAVLAVNAEELPASLDSAFSPDCEQVALSDPMSRDEVVDYVTQRLAAAGVPQSVAERFDAAAIAKLHEVSEGNPARLNAAARAHMPVASKPLAPTLPDAGLWQDPFPQEPAADDHAPTEAAGRRRGRRVRGVGRIVAASAATFGAGLLLGLWLRDGDVDRLAADTVHDRQTTDARSESSRAERATTASDSGAGPTGEAIPRTRPVSRIEAPPATAASGSAGTSAGEAGAQSAGDGGSAAQSASAGDRGSAAKSTGEARGVVETPRSEAEETSRLHAGSDPAASPDGTTPVSTAESPAAEDTKDEPPAPVAREARAALSGDSPEGAAERTGDATRADLPSGAERTESGEPPQLPLFAPELPPELTADLHLDADPPAIIEIDGRSFGPTPVRIPGLRPGVHRLVARFRTGETMTRELVLSSGLRELKIQGPLRRTPPALQPPPAATP